MREIVRKNPAHSVSKAIQSVRLEAAEKFINNERLNLMIIAELGNYKELIEMLYNVRLDCIEPTLKSRD